MVYVHSTVEQSAGAQTRRPHGTTIAPTVWLGSIRDLVTALKIIGRFLRHKIDNTVACRARAYLNQL